MKKWIALLIIMPLLILSGGSLEGEFVTSFDPGDNALYWASGTYLTEAVRFDVGEDSVTLDEVWLHYDVWDEVELYIIHTLPDTTSPSRILGYGSVVITPEYEDRWMPVDLRSAGVLVTGEFWIFVKNVVLTQPPGISMRGVCDDGSSFYYAVDVGWNESAGNFGIGILIDEPTGIEDERPVHLVPGASLDQNHPNPFNPATTISFNVSVDAGSLTPVSLEVYDVRGRLVRTLIEREVESGNHSVVWDGRDDRGDISRSGVYLSTLKVAGKTFVRKMVLIR